MSISSGAPPKNLFEGGPIVMRAARAKRPTDPVSDEAKQASRALTALAHEVARDLDLDAMDRHITSTALQSRARGILSPRCVAMVISQSDAMATEWQEHMPGTKLAGYYRRAADIVAPLGPGG